MQLRENVIDQITGISRSRLPIYYGMFQTILVFYQDSFTHTHNNLAIVHMNRGYDIFHCSIIFRVDECVCY